MRRRRIVEGVGLQEGVVGSAVDQSYQVAAWPFAEAVDALMDGNAKNLGFHVNVEPGIVADAKPSRNSPKRRRGNVEGGDSRRKPEEPSAAGETGRDELWGHT